MGEFSKHFLLFVEYFCNSQNIFGIQRPFSAPYCLPASLPYCLQQIFALAHLLWCPWLIPGDPPMTQGDPWVTQDDPWVTQDDPWMTQDDPRMTPG